MDWSQPGGALSHTGSPSGAPPQRMTKNKDQGAKVIYLDFLEQKKNCFKLQKNTIVYILEVSHSGNEP